MTLHVLHAGDGYSYLTDQVASADREREAGQDMADYYLAHGTPPGQWWGAGLDALADPEGLIGHQHEALAVSGMVDEAQMKALFGEGLHPNADALIEHLIDGGMDAEDAVKAARLGRKFPAYANEIPLLVATDAAVRRHTSEHGRRPSVAQTKQIQHDIADQLFTDEHGRGPRTDRELASWIVHEKAKVRQPVAGFDLVFTPVKSVSVLWGLGDDVARRAVEDAHHAAVTDSLEWLQHEAIYTRTGDAGERQIDTRGIAVAKFDHFDNRAGDPNFHTHATVSVKVQGDDGVWRSIDSKALHRHAVAASQRYNARVVTELRSRLGVDVTVRGMGDGKQPVVEIAGIDEGLREMFSSRRSEIEARHEVLVREYRERHSKMPSDKASYALFQQATLDTRQGKPQARSLAQMRAMWRDKAIDHLGSPEALAAMLAGTLHPDLARERDYHDRDVTRVVESAHLEADEVVSHLEDRKATWTDPMIRGAVEAHLAPRPFASEDHRRAAIEDTISAVRDRSIALRTPQFAATPAALRRADGESQLDRHGELLHTSRRVLDAEAELLEATRTPTAHIVTREVVDRECARLAKKSGRELNAGQREMVEHFTASGPLLRVGVGPAGAGKTTAMRAAAKAWEATGRNVIALAPAKAAADLLGEEVGATGAALAAITYAYRGRLVDKGIPAGTVLDFWDRKIRPGTMLLVDEASMAATADLHALTEIAATRGAIVCALGDPYQLDAVETGGMFRLLADESHAPALTDVVRFGDDHVQADNSLKVRHGDPSAVDMFAERGWLHAGTATELKTQIVADHLADTASGASGVLMAGTVADVRDLNYAVQQHHRESGRVATRRTSTLSDEHTAGRRDQIITRQNDRMMKVTGGTRKGATVANGDLWTIKKIHSDGSITARHVNHRGTVTLDADYVKRSVELGYAVTVHRAQGVTVDYARALHSVAANRRLLYVETTRGATANHLYVPTDQNVVIDTEGVHVDPTGRAPEPVEVLHAALANDGGHRAATTELRDALAAAHDPERLAEHYRAGQRILRDAYLDHVIDQALPGALLETMRTAHPDTYTRLRSVLAAEHDRGGHPVHALLDALGADDSLADAHDAGAVLAGRIATATADAVPADPHALAPLPPRHPGSDTELADWCATGARAHADAVLAHTDPLGAALATYRDAARLDDEQRLTAALSVVPARERDHIRTDPDVTGLHTQLRACTLAGHNAVTLTETAVATLTDAGDDITAATLAAAIGDELDTRTATDRRDWLDTTPRIAEALSAADIDPTHPHIAAVIDETRFAHRAGADPHALITEWIGDAANTRHPLDARADTAALAAAWRARHDDPRTAPTDPLVPRWIAPPALVDRAAGHAYQGLGAAIAATVDDIAATRPAWADALGDVPTDPARVDAWRHLAGHIAVWRNDHDITGDDTPLGPVPAREHRAAYLRLSAAIDAHRTDTTERPARRSVDPAAALRTAIGDYHRAVDELAAARVETALSTLDPAVRAALVPAGTDTTALAAVLHRVQLAGMSMTEAVDAAARSARIPDSDTTLTAALAREVGEHTAAERARWLAEHDTIATALRTTDDRVDPAALVLADDLRAREHLTGLDPDAATARLVRRTGGGDAGELLAVWRERYPGSAEPREHGTPGWVTPPPLAADAVDPERAMICAEQYQQVRAATIAAGQAAIAEHPPWVDEIGERPADPIEGAQWSSTVTQVAAYRAHHDVDDLAQPLGAAPDHAAAAQQRAHDHLTAQIERLHEAEAERIAAHNAATSHMGTGHQIDHHGGRRMGR